MVEDDRLARIAAAFGRQGLVVVVVLVLLAGAGGTLYGAAHLVAWFAAWPDEGWPRQVPARAVLVGVASACVTWLCYRVIRRLGDDETDD
ncbi:hypothetical protein ACFT2C_09645 [Promicromonospora sp. NPDC057138]|uniref:hypothetical protein n=1 Tax=Promicromonospora sp. NPDC057138 TaxID=3346031 RepID=UPI003632F6F7